MKRFTIAAIVLGLLAGAAFAQPKAHKGGGSGQEVDEAKAKEAEGIDRQYKSTLQRTRKDAAPVRTDPWSNMRGADDGKTKR